MCRLTKENASLKETLNVDKTHIEQLDQQFKIFLQERDELKRKSRGLEKKLKYSLSDKEQLNCQCETLKTEIEKLREKNVELQEEVQSTKEQLDIINTESVACRGKMKDVIEENRKTIEQIISLNEENRSLSHSIDVLRQRSECTNSFTQEEMGKLNFTIAELRDNLERTRSLQDEEEKDHHNEVMQLNETIGNLEEKLKSLEEKYEKDVKICKICRGKSKVGFLESSEVQANLESKESELVKALEDAKSKMKVEIERRNSQIQILKSKVSELETSLITCEERAANLQDAEQMKKLSRQKKCYEEIIAYFKHEMGLMADQLNNLQELLTLSNESAQQETSKIMHAFMEVQSINEKLSSQLCACEQKVQLENQMNQIHEARICELQQLVNEKEIDLSKHDQAVLNIRKTLNDSVKQNKSLQETIIELNDTIAHLQCAIKQYEYENCASKKSCLEFQEQIGSYCSKFNDVKRDLEEKTAECLKLEMSYNNEKRALKAAQKQLQETERLQQENQRGLINSLEDVQRKLSLSDENNSKLCQECENLQSQLANLARKEAVKDLEIKRYRKIVGDLKSTMIELNTELNKNLAQKELKSGCKNADCGKNWDKDDPKLQDICLSCPCEVEFYQKMVDILKVSILELKQKLTETQQKNQALEEDLKQRDTELAELRDLKKELERSMFRCATNDTKMTELEREIQRLTQELQVKSLQLCDVKRSANEINGSKCVQLACAQEENANLKDEMTNILNRQYILKHENEELQAQTAQLHCTVNCLNEKTKVLKDQIDQHLSRIKNLTTEKETLLRKNKELLSELRAIQSITCSSDKQQRERICSNQKPPLQGTCRTSRAATYNNLCTSPYSLGSQGTASFYDGESPSPSPDFMINNEWYSGTFRSESEDSEEDYCVNTLENLTQQMKKSNKIWVTENRSRKDCRVTKDTKEK